MVISVLLLQDIFDIVKACVGGYNHYRIAGVDGILTAGDNDGAVTIDKGNQ